jgi:hypothetical protein
MVLVYVTGVTLGEQGLEVHGSDMSSVLVEVKCTSPGMMKLMKELLKSGRPVMSVMGSIDDDSLLLLLKPQEGSAFLRISSDASPAGSSEK